ncbi:phosphodiesterase [Aquabacterium lacunae]|uniref:Phosphodiesterase n=1 Tax=Aquabacterium lacunae TaxID=2528630 RepID=A0A4Q9H2U0_9BURK|nr:alkaline phosphatase D family protein [Aquabacterium lacunae]TBO31397.1 phosphodiesterase [Aquabacterium lacunae]
MHRRDFLRQANWLAASMAWQQVFAREPARAVQATRAAWLAWQAPPEVFALGVASGDPGPGSVVLWTRLAPKPLQPEGGMPDHPVAVTWFVSRDERGLDVVQSGEVVTDTARAHSVHVEVKGLAGAATYHYGFVAGGVRSPVGRTRTAPMPQQEVPRLRLALASCQHYEQGAYTAHRDIARQDLDVVVFVGDYIYEGPAHHRRRRRAHPIDVEALEFSLPAYRMHHASYKLDPDLRASHAAHPWLMVWDDHEVFNDYDGQSAEDWTPEQFLQVRARAYQAYFEHTPLSPTRAPVAGHSPFHALRPWGRLATFWLLDTRQFRAPQPCHDVVHAPYRGRLLWRCDAAQTAARSLLGSAQEHWLADTLATSQSAWRLIVQTTQLSPGGFGTPWGPLAYADGWDAFPQARERLMRAIAEPRVPDVVVLGGDVHRHVAANLRLRPGDVASPIVASEFVTSSISSQGLSELLTAWMKRSNPDMLHARSDERGYALIDVDPQRVLCEFRATPHPVRADSIFHAQARYEVRRGVPGPQRVLAAHAVNVPASEPPAT